MVDIGVPDSYRVIDDLIEAGDFDGARARLATHDEDEPGYTVLKLKLGLRDGSLPPPLVENRVVQLLRKDPRAHGARELFQEASAEAFRLGQSSLSHSHPPPPVKDPDDPES
jgi:hypothetical protein